MILGYCYLLALLKWGVELKSRPWGFKSGGHLFPMGFGDQQVPIRPLRQPRITVASIPVLYPLLTDFPLPFIPAFPFVDLRQDPYGQDDHVGGGALRLDR